MSSPLTALLADSFFTGQDSRQNTALLFRDGKILDLVASDAIPSDALKVSIPECLVIPGLIDLQVNGGGNVLFNNEPSKEGVLALARAHRAFGTTRLLPTLLSDTTQVLSGALQGVREARREDSSVLGIHFEGPFIARMGTHDPAMKRHFQDEDARRFAPRKDEVILLTVAPEQITPDQIRLLVEQGNIVFLGHTDATPEAVSEALQAGARGFTHLFNGMGGLSSRKPGPLGVALDDRDSFCGLIADGQHVAPSLVRLACRAKPQGKLFLVSDAMPPAAAESPHDYGMGGKTVFVKDGLCVDENGVLTGSGRSLLEIVRIAIREIGIAPSEAFRMASTYPADALGLGDRLGQLRPGYAADMVALSRDFKPVAVWRDGVRAF